MASKERKSEYIGYEYSRIKSLKILFAFHILLVEKARFPVEGPLQRAPSDAVDDELFNLQHGKPCNRWTSFRLRK